MKHKLLLVVALLAVGSSYAQIKVKQGNKFKKITSMELQSTMEMMGQPMEMGNKTTSYEDVEVATADGNSFKFVHTTKRLVMETSAMGFEMSVDSDDSTKTDATAVAVRERINKSYSVTVDKKGKIASTDLPKEATNPAEVTKLMQGGSYELVIPGGKPPALLKVGDTWTETVNQDKVTINSTYKVMETGKTLAISVDSKVSIKGAPMQFQAGMEALMNMEGTVAGKNYYSSETGLLTKGSSVTNSTGTLTIGGQETPMTIKMNMTTELQKM